MRAGFCKVSLSFLYWTIEYLEAKLWLQLALYANKIEMLLATYLIEVSKVYKVVIYTVKNLELWLASEIRTALR